MDALQPVQDWDIIALKDSPYRDLMVGFVKDRDCPKRDFFLHVFYLQAGDIYRATVVPEAERRSQLEALAVAMHSTGNYGLAMLANRIEDLLTGSLPFDYDSWCSGGYAYQQRA